MSKVVLITGIGGDISQGVATILKENRPDLYLIGIDIHSQHGGHLFVDQFFLVPPAADKKYLESIKDIVRKNSVEIVIPMSELELAVTRNFAEITPGVKWITAGDRVVSVGLDKYKTANALVELGLPIPWTKLVSDGCPDEFPCILKSRTGSGSRTVFTVSDIEDAEYLTKRYPDAIFQELLEPANREITCAVYRRSDGDVFTLLMLRRLTGGFTGWAKVISDKETMQMCEVIAKGLDLNGSMNIQLRLTDRGPRVFEINPRFSSTVLMRHRLGFSDLLWAIEEAEDKLINFPDIPENKLMVRTQEALVYQDNNIGIFE